MPFPMKIQPLDHEIAVPKTTVAGKSRLKRLFESKFPGVLRTPATTLVPAPAGRTTPGALEVKDGGGGDFEPSSLCLSKMVQNFLEESNEKPSRCGRRRCNCFHGNCDDSSDGESDFFCVDAPVSSSFEPSEILKSLVPCASLVERNLLADVSKIVEKNKSKCGGGGGGGGKIDRSILVESLISLGYNAAVCKSRWEKTSASPAGEYEYVDVVTGNGERVLIDVDFRSEFEIARSTKTYRSVLQIVPAIFVGKTDRVQQIVAVVLEAAKQSMKKKGLHVPPWRKPEYMRSKWVSSYQRFPPPPDTKEEKEPDDEESRGGGCDSGDGSVLVLEEKLVEGDAPNFGSDEDKKLVEDDGLGMKISSSEEKNLVRDERSSSSDENASAENGNMGDESLIILDSRNASDDKKPVEDGDSGTGSSLINKSSEKKMLFADGLGLRLEKSGEQQVATTTSTSTTTCTAAPAKWQLPAIEPKAVAPRGKKVVTGLSSIFC